MSSGRRHKLRHTLAFRLTLWYAAIFVLSATIASVVFYLLLSAAIRQRVDENLLAKSNELRQIYALQGIDMLQRAAVLQAQAVGEKKLFFQLFYPSGLVFASSNMSYWKSIRIDRGAVEAVIQGVDHVYTTHDLPEQGYKTRVIYDRIGTAVILQLGYSLEDENRLLQSFKKIFLLTMTALLVMAVAAGWFMARRALSGVESITRTARQISVDDLTTRVSVPHHYAEIDRLAVTFNQMLDRIQKLVAGIRKMNDNIAHDLRSPITRIRGLAEVTLTGAGDMEDYSQMAASTIEECDRLLSMINTMLTISHTEAGIDPTRLEPIDLTAVVKEACELFQPLAEDKHISLTCTCNGTAMVRGDQDMLQRMVANLIDNAVKYTNPSGRIQVRVDQNANGGMDLSVADTGIGIPEQDQHLVFHRFFRSDRSRSPYGAGLGLSLAQAVARAHGGDIQLSSQVGKGSRFTVSLPVVKS